MAIFEKYPKEIRKSIAIFSTAIVGILLVGIMLSFYLSKSKNNTEGSEVRTKIVNFYNAILGKDVLSRD